MNSISHIIRRLSVEVAAVILLAVTSSYAGWGVITEVAFEERAPNSRWVEIFVTQQGNIEGAKLFYRANLAGSVFNEIIEFPDVSVEEGDYLIVEFSSAPGETDKTDGQVKVFYSTMPASAPSVGQGAVYLTDTDGSTWMDGVLFISVHTDNLYLQSAYDTMVSEGVWSPPSEPSWEDEDFRDRIPGKIGSSTLRPENSIQRKRDSVTGHPVSVNSVSAWSYGRNTRGAGYFATPPTIDDDDFIVYPNPYNPDTGQTAQIVLPDGYSKAPNRLRIYTADGAIVLEKDVSMSRIEWDGRNRSGQRAASGQYFYYLEMEDGSGESGKITLIR